MSAVLPEGRLSPPYKATPSRNFLSGAGTQNAAQRQVCRALCADGGVRNYIAPDPWRPSKFLTDCEAPARAELARRKRGKAGGSWEHAGAAAMRAVRSAAVADGGER